MAVILAAGFFLLGVEVIETIIEDPFGTEPDDVPLERYSATIGQSVEEIFWAGISTKQEH